MLFFQTVEFNKYCLKFQLKCMVCLQLIEDLECNQILICSHGSSYVSKYPHNLISQTLIYFLKIMSTFDTVSTSKLSTLINLFMDIYEIMIFMNVFIQ